MNEGSAIASVGDVPDDGSFLFRVLESGAEDPEEAILLRAGEEVVAYLNYCQHFTHIRLDKGDGVPIRDDELICSNHGAMFDVESGRCTHGPCLGAYLVELSVAVADGSVYLDEENYQYVGPGPVEHDELDLTSTSNVEF